MQIPAQIPSLSVRFADAGDLTPAVAELRIQLRLNCPALCEIALFGVSTPPALASGFTILVGAPRSVLFAGEVTSITREYSSGGAPLLRLRGHDALHRLRRSQVMRGFDGMDTAEIASRISAPHGLSVRGSGGPRWSRVLQTRQSDLGLLQELAAAAGLGLRLQETEIELIPASGDGHSVALDGVRDFVDLAVEENVSRAASSVGVRGWNVGGTTAVRGEAAGQAGAPLAFSRLGVFCETDAAAQVFAEAEAARRKQEHVTVRGLAHGNAALRPGSSIELTGPDLPRTRVVLQSVTHTVDPTRGFLTEISSAAALAPAASASRGAPLEASLAEVTSVADPERQGRVRLRLLALGGLETGWMPVLLPGAGLNKGLFALPSPGDRVLVLLLGEHPVQGVVIGGLFGQNAPADHGIDGDAVKRFSLQTPGGQRVTLDDATRKLLLEQPDGASILLGPDEARLTAKDGSFLSMTGDTTVLHASGNLTLRAPGGKLKIAADAVDFEKS